MKIHGKELNTIHSKVHENSYLLNSLVTTMQFRTKHPLSEHKINSSVRESSISKYNLKEPSYLSKPQISSIIAISNLKSFATSHNRNSELSKNTNSLDAFQSKTTFKSSFNDKLFHKESSHNKHEIVIDKSINEKRANSSQSRQLCIKYKCLTTRESEQPSFTLGSNTPQINNIPLQTAGKITIAGYLPAKCSLKSNGIIEAYAANTNQGLVR